MNSEDELLTVYQSEGARMSKKTTQHTYKLQHVVLLVLLRIESVVYVKLFYLQKVVFKSIFVQKALSDFVFPFDQGKRVVANQFTVDCRECTLKLLSYKFFR